MGFTGTGTMRSEQPSSATQPNSMPNMPNMNQMVDAMKAMGMSGGKKRRSSTSKSRRVKSSKSRKSRKSRKSSKVKRGGMGFGAILKEAIVPFGLLALQRRRTAKKSFRNKSSKRFRTSKRR